MRLLLLDNFDSFTYNLYHYLEAAGFNHITVVRNDINTPRIWENYDVYVLSPGPGLPAEAGCMEQVISHAAAQKKPLLGICLGHQALGEYFGMKLKNLHQVYHGRQHDGFVIAKDNIFVHLEETQKVARYHSWTIDKETFNATEFKLLMIDQEQEILAMKHNQLPIYGLQFHPESVLTPRGLDMMKNFYEFSCQFNLSNA